MSHRLAVTILAASVVLSLVTSQSTAQVYAAEDEPGRIISYDGAAGTVVNPDDPITGVRGISLDEFGRIIIAACCDQADVMRFDVDTQTLEYLDAHGGQYAAEDVYPDPANESIYVIKNRLGEVLCHNFLGVLPGGTGPAVPIENFPVDDRLVDLQVRPMGEGAGNILVLVDVVGGWGTGYLAEFRRTGPGSYERLPDVVTEETMVGDPGGFAITTDGVIVVVDRELGLHEVIEGGGGTLVPFGDAVGPDYGDLEIASDGTFYLVNELTNVVERYDELGARILPDLSGGITSPTAVTAASFAPTPEGEYAFTEPIEGVQITFEEVTDAGFTVAVAESSVSYVSPEGNYLPDYAALPGTRAASFYYVSLATEAVYRSLIQVDVFREGSRLFYASGVGDTFRDFTVVGSIDDARGTMPRFTELTPAGGRMQNEGPTEIVLVEDTRADSQVTLYKFWRLAVAMETLEQIDVTPCPWEVIVWLRKYAEKARSCYDEGDLTCALSELSILNEQLRSYAGWCIPEMSDDTLGNLVGMVLAHSKTLMFSIELEMEEPTTGIEEGASAFSLSIVSPSDDGCELTLSGPGGSEVAVRVYSASGRHVDTVFEGRLGHGPETLTWAGTESGGRRVASGVYFVRVEASDGALTSKVVYVR
jgi:hypothetical protein